LLVLTGDSHSFWRNRLFDAQGRAMGVELGTTGVSSPGDFIEFGDTGARLVDARLATSNEEVLWTDGRHNGYLRISIERDFARADYIAVSTVLSTDYSVSVLDSAVIERAHGQLSYRDRS
ncbi:MAG: alkaline phosphatase D family protein, partial [Pseudomonadota bacterium]